MGAKASVALVLVTLGLLEPISPAWAKKDRVEVTLTAPAASALYNAPAAVVLSAIAQAKQKNHPIAKVEFFQGTSLVGSVTGPRADDQYTLSWTGVAAGTYSLTARATNNKGDTDLSDPVSITVNGVPSVSLTSPSSNAAFKAPANIPLAVQVADTDGSIANVEYFYGTTSITSLSAPPYSFVWTEVPQGTYALTARVTDNLGASMTSVPVNVTVNAAEAKLYYIHVDHLNTPRLIADDQQQTVWRWDQQEPFGVNVPDENPSRLGVFELPLRLPGQYHDKETNLHYNMRRDYDPNTGRYEESDPIGLAAGVNTYAYVLNSPLSYVDPLGLVMVCYYYDAALAFGHIGFGAGSEQGTSGYYPTGNAPGSPGVVKKDEQQIKECKVIPSNPDQDDCMLKCRAERASNPGTYKLTTNQCTSFVRECLTECGLPAGNSQVAH